MTPPAGQDDPTEREVAARIPPYLRAHLPPPQWSDPAPERGEGDRGAAQPSGPTLRPFVLTSGRVHAAPGIGLETQVTVRPSGASRPGTLPAEMQVILALCTEPISVAELSARTGLHLGVTKVLVSDLSAAGHLDVHVHDASLPHRPETIMRVIRGLRAIS